LVAVGILALGGPQVASGTTPFTARQVPASWDQTSWSPDGRWIAFGSEDPERCCGGFFVTLLAVDGSAQRVLGNGLWAVWSPDGRRIAWLDYRHGNRLAVADPDTGDIRLPDLAVSDAAVGLVARRHAPRVRHAGRVAQSRRVGREQRS
jgi:WD40-like Beta Propeller Repeat